MQYLVHIGYPKAGSTWLQRTIFSGGQEGIQPLLSAKTTDPTYQKSGGTLFFSFLKKEHKGNNGNIIYPFVFDVQEVQEEIKARTPKDTAVTCLSSEVWTGHPFNGGMASKEFADRIHAALPEAKILIIIRRQEDMLLSAYAHFLEKAGAVCGLKKFLQTHHHNHIPWNTPYYYCYDMLISYYIKLFGKDNVLVLPFELIKVDQGMGLIEPIYDFLNISIPENINLMPPNNTRDYRIYTILSRLPWLNILSRPHPANGYIGINQTGIRDLLIKTAEIVVTQQVQNRIIGSDKKLIEIYLKPFIILSNKKTQELTGLDLAQYNYTLS